MHPSDQRRRGAEGVHGALGFSPAAFTLLRDLVAQRTGVHYGDGKEDLLADRLAPLVTARGLPSLLDYYYLLKYDPEAEEAWSELRDRLAVPETYFWRQPEQFEALAEVILPCLLAHGRRSLRIWSAACCSGEEPLSIAMALDRGGWFDRMQIEIIGSDASPALVERARAGRYGERSLRSVPADLRDRYLVPSGREWQVDPQLHARVRWATINLMDPAQAGPLAESDVIFCRNVFIYFSDEGIRRVARLFHERMPADGALFVAASESLARLGTGFSMEEAGAAFVYVKSPAAAAGASAAKPRHARHARPG